MSVVCVIPARYNSSRFPGKLLAMAFGKTILQRTFEQAAKCHFLDALYIATDNEQIADHVHGFGGKILWTSSAPKNGTERIIEALEQNRDLQAASYILNLQGDHPCTEPKTIHRVIKAIDSDPVAALATAVSFMIDRDDFLSSHTVKCVFDNQKNALYFSRSPIPYHPPHAPIRAFAHIGIYCYRTSFLTQLKHLHATSLQIAEDLEQLKILEGGHRIKIALVDEKTLSVDTPEDLLKLEKHLCQ